MIAFVFDRRSLVLLGTGAVFLALVLVAVGFLLGVQYGVLPPSAPQSATAQANPSMLPTRVTGMADEGSSANGTDAQEPDSGLTTSDAEPIDGDGGFADRTAPESLPYTDAPAGDGPLLDDLAPQGSRASATPAAASRFDPPADPIVDSRGGAPVPLAPSPPSIPGIPDRPSRRDDATEEPRAENVASGAEPEPAAPAGSTAGSASGASTPIAAAVTLDSGRFAVQVGAYRERLNCDAMVQKLSARGFEPYVVEIERDGQAPIYAVRVGRFGDRASAAKAASSLRTRAGVSVVVLSIG